ncbi:hypothetical protein ACFQ67_01420 [Streptomyces sp. NPDC056488]|uniref:hypothetical protein n=1 Tax=Streptomyces sp. NPDC056488 TaxID=3345836 RepID=UPI003690DF49
MDHFNGLVRRALVPAGAAAVPAAVCATGVERERPRDGPRGPGTPGKSADFSVVFADEETMNRSVRLPIMEDAPIGRATAGRCRG